MNNDTADIFNLFSETDTNPAGPASKVSGVSLIRQNAAKPLSKSQKLFNSLIKKIDAKKSELLVWQETLPKYRLEVANAYLPLDDEYSRLRMRMVRFFDEVIDHKLFKKTDKSKLKYLITEISGDLIDNGYDELITVHDKHADASYDEMEKEADEFAGQTLKSIMEMAFGIDLGDEADVSSPDKLADLIRQKTLEQENRKRQTQDRREPRKKSAKQLEREAQKERNDQAISQSIREAYRKLSSSLHPDREQDPAERERKTAIMQRVNAAYAKKDLLKLLELQLEAEQIDPAYINSIAEDRLKYINKLLQEQLGELEQEIDELIFPLLMQFEMPRYANFTPEILMGYLRRDIQGIKADIKKLKEDLSFLQDLSNLKAWLKSYRIPRDSYY